MIAQAIFYFFAALAVISGVMVVTNKNPMHSVMYLAFSVLSVAGVFFVLEADFLGAIQIMVYAGGIVVLYIFVIIIINLNKIQKETRGFFPRVFIISVPVLIIAEIAAVIYKNGFNMPTASDGSMNIQTLARVLLSTYLIPFEIASVLLLAVLVGSIIIARKGVGDDSN